MKFLKYLLLILLIPSMSYAQSIWDLAAYGSTPGIQFISITGNNGGITTTYEPIWQESGAYTVLLTAMSSPYCASASANDTSAGTGARTILVKGITSAFAAFSETVTMNGQTSVNLTNTTAQFINSITVMTAGSGTKNAGSIRCGTGVNSSGVPAVVHAQIATGFNQSQMAWYGVPASKTLLCKDIMTGSSGATANLALDTIYDTYTNNGIPYRYSLSALQQSASSSIISPNILAFPEKTIVVFSMAAATSTGPGFFSANCLLIDKATANTNQTYF